jgi:hypothetical protein
MVRTCKQLFEQINRCDHIRTYVGGVSGVLLSTADHTVL